jgi:hypothetical protein
MNVLGNIVGKQNVKHPSHPKFKTFFEFVIDFGCSFKTLSLHIVDGLLENNTNHIDAPASSLIDSTASPKVKIM